jgi:hypothetical protein
LDRFKRSVAALALLLATGSVTAQMYKCVDAQGRTHYADQPTPGCSNTKVDIRPSAPLSGGLAAPPEDTARQEADFRRRQMEREQAEETARAERAQLESRCAVLRQETATLSSGRRLVRINENGEREYVDDAVRERRLAELHAALEGCPASSR